MRRGRCRFGRSTQQLDALQQQCPAAAQEAARAGLLKYSEAVYVAANQRGRAPSPQEPGRPGVLTSSGVFYVAATQSVREPRPDLIPAANSSLHSPLCDLEHLARCFEVPSSAILADGDRMRTRFSVMTPLSVGRF